MWFGTRWLLVNGSNAGTNGVEYGWFVFVAALRVTTAKTPRSLHRELICVHIRLERVG